MTTTWTGERADGTTYRAVLSNDGTINWTFGDKTATTVAPPVGARVNIAAAGFDAKAHIALETVDGRAMVAPRDMVDAIHADLQPTPVVSLEDQRAMIVSRIAAARDASQVARNRAWEREDSSGSFRRNRGDAEEVAAIAELAAFDAAHPEIAAAIKTARDARTERHIWD